jgi:hypothetical protein
MDPVAAYDDDHAPRYTRLASDVMVGGAHYQATQVQPWDVIESWMHEDQDGFEAFLWGNALKYMHRYRRKGAPIQDIKKAIHYLERLEEYVNVKRWPNERS